MPDQRPPALFLADARGLDFLNTVATPADREVDWIADSDGLLAWLEQAELVPAQVLKSLKEKSRPKQLDEVAAEARRLREWFRAFVRQHKGRPLVLKDAHALEPLNRLLAHDASFGRVAVHGHGKDRSLAYETARRWDSPDALLLPIGETLAKFVCEEDFSHVKACEGPACTLLFADHTRGRARRWCSMAICGNRAKQAAHRQRLRMQG